MMNILDMVPPAPLRDGNRSPVPLHVVAMPELKSRPRVIAAAPSSSVHQLLPQQSDLTKVKALVRRDPYWTGYVSVPATIL